MRLTAGVAVALLLTACGSERSAPVAGPSASASPLAGLDPCSLLTPADIEGVVGRPVLGSRSDRESPGARRCTWTIDPEIPEVVTLVVYTTDARVLHEAGRTDLQGDPRGDVEDVSGIAEDAYWEPALQTFNVLLGDRAYFVQLGLVAGSLSPERIRAGSEQLARAALGRFER